MRVAIPNLQDAVLSGNLKLIKRLIAGGAELDTVNENGNTPLLEAAIAGKSEIGYLLLKAGANVNHQNLQGLTALHISAEGYSLRKGEKVRLKMNYYWFLLELFSRGAKPLQNNFAQTPLMLMVEKLKSLVMPEESKMKTLLISYESAYYSPENRTAYISAFSFKENS